MPATAPAAKLTGSDRKVLAVLAEYAGEVSNPDLKAAHGFTLVGAQRRKLDAKGYVASRKQGRYFVHITEIRRAWGRCRNGDGYVHIADLAAHFDLTPQDVKRAILEMRRRGTRVRLSSQSNRKILTETDLAYEFELGGERRNLIYIED